MACEALGLGVCYMGTTLWAMDKIGAELKLPEGVTAVTSLVVGWPVSAKQNTRRTDGRTDG